MNDLYEIYNPHNRPIEDLPIIYGFNDGGSRDWWIGQVIAENGCVLGSHLCGSEDYMYTDLGIIRALARIDMMDLENIILMVIEWILSP